MSSGSFWGRDKREEAFLVACRDKGGNGKFEPVDGLYALDYRASQVNFLNHQRRCFELAELLSDHAGDETNDIVDFDKKIAVLGGGIGGVTVFLALRAKGFENVKLFETGKKLFGVQLGCNHRHAHPMAITWPKTTFSSTSDLPFLNWGAADADSVVRQMASDPLFEWAVERFSDDIHTETPILEVNRGDEGKWELTSDKDLDPARRQHDIVVYAMGFGPERHVFHSRSDDYWWDDNLENYVREKHRFTNYKHIVSGQGDGALIDAARIGFGLDKSEDPVPSFISRARAEKFQTPPLELETGGADENSSFEKAVVDLFRSLGDDKDLLQKLRDCIDDQLNRAPTAPASKKMQYLVQRAKDRCADLVLVGRRAFGPRFEGDTSNLVGRVTPVNALLFALLETVNDTKRVFRNGDVGPKATLAPKPSGSRAKSRPKVTLNVTPQDNEATHELETNLVFLRHGPSDIAMSRIRELDGKERKPYQQQDHPEARHTIDDRHDFMARLGMLDIDEAGDAKAVAWDFRATCAFVFLKHVVKLKDFTVTYERTDDPEPQDYLKISLPILTESPDVDYTPDKKDTAARNYFAIMDIGGFDRQMFGAPVVYAPVDGGGPAEFKASAVHKTPVPIA